MLKTNNYMYRILENTETMMALLISHLDLLYISLVLCHNDYPLLLDAIRMAHYSPTNALRFVFVKLKRILNRSAIYRLYKTSSRTQNAKGLLKTTIILSTNLTLPYIYITL